MTGKEQDWQPLIDAFQRFSDAMGSVGMKVPENETRLYDCGRLPVELTLPEGGHMFMNSKINYVNEGRGFLNIHPAVKSYFGDGKPYQY